MVSSVSLSPNLLCLHASQFVMKRTSSALSFSYAAFLFVCGICGYYLGPHHASTALVGGVAGGILVAGLSLLNRQNVLWAHPALRSAIAVFALTFAWRAAGAWSNVVQGLPDFSPVAVLLSLMCVVSLSVLVLVLRSR